MIGVKTSPALRAGEVETRSGEGEGAAAPPNHVLLRADSRPSVSVAPSPLALSRLDLSRAAGEVG
jgi:hypothetical protein